MRGDTGRRFSERYERESLADRHRALLRWWRILLVVSALSAWSMLAALTMLVFSADSAQIELAAVVAAVAAIAVVLLWHGPHD